MKSLVKWCDIHKSITASKELMKEYKGIGYEVEPLILPFFKLLLDDGYVLISYEKDGFYSRTFTFDDVEVE